MESKTIVSKTGVRQSHVPSRLTLIPAEVVRLEGAGLAFGAAKYGDDNWKSAPNGVEDHRVNVLDNLDHALDHIFAWLEGDESEPHLVNARMRIGFALWHAIKAGDQPREYIHPEAARVTANVRADFNGKEEE